MLLLLLLLLAATRTRSAPRRKAACREAVERAKPVEVPDPSRTAGKRIGEALASGPKAPTFLFNSSSALSSLFSNVAAAVAWFFLPGLPCVLSLDLAMEVTMKVRVNLSMALHVVLRGKSVSNHADGGTKIRSFERTESDHVEVRILSPATQFEALAQAGAPS
jgi:hypothetical protein